MSQPLFNSDIDLVLYNAMEALVAQCHEDNYHWWRLPDGTNLWDNPLIVATKIALIHSELSEALEGDRKSAMSDKIEGFLAVEEELADAIIRICDLAGAQRYRLGAALIAKRAYNASRADHKIENRAKTGGKKY